MRPIVVTSWEVEYRSLNPDGKAMLRAAVYLVPPEVPSHDYPFHLTTGRTLYHFHTRTKTARAPQLQKAAPDVWVEISPASARAHDLNEGDLAEVATPRGAVRAAVRISDMRDGVLPPLPLRLLGHARRTPAGRRGTGSQRGHRH
ncbi:periplasmic nitrate reductase [Streptomyces griseoflavus Tu4000]|uniref:Periplasmic nitrate reductase n=1 Tax=Streptomyces griseoflavus Tu4000 TaxID=467200 RepID=D9XJA3_9ACTN|nr:periplasmic nitrate reductase [Streptomyces griseoflavus Tu4000]